MKRSSPLQWQRSQPHNCRAGTDLFIFRMLLRQRALDKRSLNHESGYILQVAILTAFVLIIGVAAFASRTGSGLFGAIDQSLNRDARDVAESAITEFQNTMNRPENRYLLAKGTNQPWATTDSNPCTSSVDSSGKIIDGTSTPVSAATIRRFSPSSRDDPKALDPADLSSAPAKSFWVESIAYKDSNRIDYPSNTITLPYNELLRGGTRALLRVTVVGKVVKNGVESTSRVAREFEVVPKCCGRSFGMNTYGGVNWGRDNASCNVTTSNSTGNGIVGALDGSGSRGSSNQLDIRDQNNDLISQAICWQSNDPSGGQSILTGSPNPDCLANQLRIGASGNSTGLSFIPTAFNLTLPLWPPASSGVNFDGSPLPQPTTSLRLTSSMTGNNTYYVRLKMDEGKPVGIERCVLSGNSLSSCVPLAGAGNDPCSYKVIAYPWPATGEASGGVPYYEASCRLKNIESSSNTTIIFDTSNVKINLHFDDSSYAGEYMGGSGRTTIQRVHCRRTSSDLSVPPSSSSVCNQVVDWNAFQLSCPLLIKPGEPDSKLSCSLNYSMSELLNVYATGAGSFDLNGGASVIGFNLIAPKADVELRGGGSADPNFMGRIWADSIYLNGNVKIRTLSTNPAFCDEAFGGVGDEQCPPTGKTSLFDFIARSFSHASGF